MIRSLIASRVLTWDSRASAWRGRSPADQVQIPDTLQGVIVARLDRLDEDVKHVLKIASVIGRSFLYRVLAAIGAASANHLPLRAEMTL